MYSKYLKEDYLDFSDLDQTKSEVLRALKQLAKNHNNSNGGGVGRAISRQINRQDDIGNLRNAARQSKQIQDKIVSGIAQNKPGFNPLRPLARGLNRSAEYWGKEGEGGKAVKNTLGTAWRYYTDPIKRGYNATGKYVSDKIHGNIGKIALGAGAAGTVIGAKAAMSAADADRSKARKERDRYDY